MKSIRHIAEKYGGAITVDAKDDIFALQVLIPLEILGYYNFISKEIFIILTVFSLYFLLILKSSNDSITR